MDSVSSPLSVVAGVARIVTQVSDRLMGDRVDYPLLVATACVEALKTFGIESRVMYGSGAWVEILEDHRAVWAGAWGDHYHFWVATQYGEIVDLNTSVAHRKSSVLVPEIKALYSPPLLWSSEVPRFYRYQPDGVAEVDPLDDSDRTKCEHLLAEVKEKCVAWPNPPAPQDFPNEAILCPMRKLLDDSRQSFRHYDRFLSIQGIPDAPF